MYELYTILGINNTASLKEIRTAYRNKAKKYHPDKNNNKGANKQFLNISNAYEILSNNDTKKRYDNEQYNQQYNQKIIDSNLINIFEKIFETSLDNFISKFEYR
jgi:DnaJ-class molecular chaperone